MTYKMSWLKPHHKLNGRLRKQRRELSCLREKCKLLEKEFRTPIKLVDQLYDRAIEVRESLRAAEEELSDIIVDLQRVQFEDRLRLWRLQKLLAPCGTTGLKDS